MEVTNDQIDIKTSKNFPVGNCKGVSINSKATYLINELYRINTPDFSCSEHAATGSMKNIAKSEIRCIDEVKSFYNSLKSVVKH